jgi:hypothetical protein
MKVKSVKFGQPVQWKKGVIQGYVLAENGKFDITFIEGSGIIRIQDLIHGQVLYVPLGNVACFEEEIVAKD